MCVLLQFCCDKWKKNHVPAQHTAHRNPVHRNHYVALGFNLHTLFAKMMFGLTDAIISKETSQGAAQLLEHNKQTSEEIMNIVPNASFIKKARPVGGAVNATEKTQLGLRAIPVHTGYGCCMFYGYRTMSPLAKSYMVQAWFGFVPYRLMHYSSKWPNTAIRVSFGSFLIDGPVTFPSLPFSFQQYLLSTYAEYLLHLLLK
jgi:hypothetical protein